MSVKSVIFALAKFTSESDFRAGSTYDDNNLEKLTKAKKILALTAEGALIVQDKPGFFTRIKEFLFGVKVDRDLSRISEFIKREINDGKSSELTHINSAELKAARIALEVLQRQESNIYRKMEFTPIFRQIDNSLPVQKNRSECLSYSPIVGVFEMDIL